MNIWYLHHYATPYELPGLHRPFEFGDYFCKDGHTLTVFSSSYLHYADKNVIEDRSRYTVKEYDGVSTVFVRTCGYANSGIKRVINMFQYAWRLPHIARRYKKSTAKPDVIVASSPHPLAMLAGLWIARRMKVPCICEVRDFWPEVFFFGGALKEKSLVGRMLLAGERFIYTKADGLTFLKEGDHTYIQERGWDTESGGKIDLAKRIYVNNGVDLKAYDERMKEFVYEDEDFADDRFTVVYCGTIRFVNNLDLLLDTAKLLGDDYRFLVFGTGNCVEALQKRIDDEQIGNVKLKGYVDTRMIPSVLSHASVNLLNYSGTAYNWSRGNSSNKLFEYLASGKPVVSTVKMGYDILERYSCGFSVENTTPEEVAREIRRVREMEPDAYETACKNARLAAQEFDIPVLAQTYMNEIHRIIDRYNNGRKKDKKAV